ncbi:MAG: hypothetical protein ACU0C9_12570, partial [Paracoccaceae bacterium]
MEYDLPELLVPVLDAARSNKTALILFIDELQYLTPSEFSSLRRSCHEAALSVLPFLLIGASLPKISPMDNDEPTYVERVFIFPEVKFLDKDAARFALSAAVRGLNVTFTDEALSLILKETQRYPFFLQIWGQFVWNEADTNLITEMDVENARPAIIAHLDQNIFRVRIGRCTELEQRYLRAMAELGPGPYRTGDIAKLLQTASAEVKPV